MVGKDAFEPLTLWFSNCTKPNPGAMTVSDCPDATATYGRKSEAYLGVA